MCRLARHGAGLCPQCLHRKLSPVRQRRSGIITSNIDTTFAHYWHWHFAGVTSDQQEVCETDSRDSRQYRILILTILTCNLLAIMWNEAMPIVYLAMPPRAWQCIVLARHFTSSGSGAVIYLLLRVVIETILWMTFCLQVSITGNQLERLHSYVFPPLLSLKVNFPCS